jgi:hypothetical protein
MSRRALSVAAALVLGAIVTAPPTGPRQARSAPPGSLAGDYATFFVGQSTATQQPESGVGVVSLDDLGTLTGFEVVNLGEQICEVPLTGRYSLGPNGMGRITLIGTSPIAGCSFRAELVFVVIHGGKVLKIMGTEPGFVATNQEWHRRG